MADTPPNDKKTPIALVYWGRLGAGAALMSQIADAMRDDARFDLYLSPSLNSELPPRFPDRQMLPIRTFTGPLGLIARTPILRGAIDRLVKELKARNVRAIVTVMPHVWGLALQRAAKRTGIRTLLVVHDADPHPGERNLLLDWLVRQEIRGSDRVITLSSHVASRLLARRLVSKERLARSFHPVFNFGARPTGDRQAPLRLLFFGRILPYKGVGMLLNAYAWLRATGTEVTLTVVGRGQIDGPASLEAQPGLTIRRGWLAPDAIGDVLSEADAIVLPYLEASQSGIVAAAYGAGLPVIATPVGGLKEQVGDGRTGVLAKGTSAIDFAEAIRRLVETPGLYETCRAGAAARAAIHTAERFAEALGDVILETIAAPPTG